MRVLVTGSKGFIGSNFVSRLIYEKDIELFEFDIENVPGDLDKYLQVADIVFHLAGVNRPEKEEEFNTGNVELTEFICETLIKYKRRPLIIFTSSIQAELQNPYGKSKKAAEELLINWARKEKGRTIIFRLKNVFGKWCRPNYNSVVATFCYNISHNIPIVIKEPNRVLELVYIDDVIEAFLDIVREYRKREERSDHSKGQFEFRDISRYFKITVANLADKLNAYYMIRKELIVPNFSDDFDRFIYATFLSYYNSEDLSLKLDEKKDIRGALIEVFKSRESGQLFILRINPGQKRGNHFHHTKIEKFFVIEGQGKLKLKNLRSGEISNIIITSKDLRLIEIPPGYSHSIENTGSKELILLIWANEIFNENKPDTFYNEIKD